MELFSFLSTEKVAFSVHSQESWSSCSRTVTAKKVPLFTLSKDPRVKYDRWHALCLSGSSRDDCGSWSWVNMKVSVPPQNKPYGTGVRVAARCYGGGGGGRRRAQEHRSWSCYHITDKAAWKCTAKKDYLWVAQWVWHQACWVKRGRVVYCSREQFRAAVSGLPWFPVSSCSNNTSLSAERGPTHWTFHKCCVVMLILAEGGAGTTVWLSYNGCLTRFRPVLKTEEGKKTVLASLNSCLVEGESCEVHL